jgi:D-tyrosyl-tRNA(Tyr) deacylase
MRCVVQRVLDCALTIGDGFHAGIGNGLLVYLGVGVGDAEKDADYLAEKVVNLRIFQDEQGKMNRSVKESGGGILVVSQFTLYGDARRGRRPSWEGAAPPGKGLLLYEYYLDGIRRSGIEPQCGVFQAVMQVRYTNDGPVTILLDSARLF